MKPLIVALGGRVLGIDPSTGLALWRNEMLHGGLDYVAIAVGDDCVIASASAAKVFCITRETGETLWSTKTTGIGRASLIREEDKIFVCKGGLLDCFTAQGELIWTQNLRKVAKSGAALGFTDNVVQADGKSR